MISELTYKIVAYTEIQEVDTNESIDWAIEMMELGFESPTLHMLASFNKPTNYCEVIDYVTDTIKELGLEMKNGKEATLSYASYYVHKIAKSQKVKENLTNLYPKLNGAYKLWLDKDQLETSGNFKDHKKHGEWRLYEPEMIKIERYDMDSLIGVKYLERGIVSGDSM